MEYIQFYISDIYLAVSPSHHELISEKQLNEFEDRGFSFNRYHVEFNKRQNTYSSIAANIEYRFIITPKGDIVYLSK